MVPLMGMLSIVLSFITTCLLKQKSHFRQQQKLLKVLQAIESDSARLGWVVSPTEEQVLDPEVRTLTCEAFPGHSHLACRLREEGPLRTVVSILWELL